MALSDVWVDFFAGWASGAVSVVICQPLDTLLTRAQAGNSLVVGSASGSILDQSRGLVSNYGVRSLWRGSSAMISAVPMQNALLMGGYGIGKQFAANSNDDQKFSSSLLSIFIGGCSGGILQSFIMSPVEMVKINQQVHAQKTAGIAWRELMQAVTKASGWKGLNATLLRDGVPHGVWFASYEWCKQDMLSLVATPENRNSSLMETIVVPITSGAVAATVAWVSCLPVVQPVPTYLVRTWHHSLSDFIPLNQGCWVPF